MTAIAVNDPLTSFKKSKKAMNNSEETVLPLNISIDRDEQ